MSESEGLDVSGRVTIQLGALLLSGRGLFVVVVWLVGWLVILSRPFILGSEFVCLFVCLCSEHLRFPKAWVAVETRTLARFCQ